jgi:hypothetical protein
LYAAIVWAEGFLPKDRDPEVMESEKPGGGAWRLPYISGQQKLVVSPSEKVALETNKR